jgi:hypothetical protein
MGTSRGSLPRLSEVLKALKVIPATKRGIDDLAGSIVQGEV